MDGFHTRHRFRALALVVACCCIVARASAESFTTNIIDGVTTNAAGPFTLGDTGPFNFLLLTNGGRLTNTTGAIGNVDDAHDNLAMVVGAGSRWDSSSTLRVGIEGASNRLSILDGGRVTSSSGQLGLSNSSWGNLVILAGAGSAWETTGPNVGSEGSWNRLEVSDGAWVKGVRGGVGLHTNASHNLARVTGAGSSWTNSGRFHVGSQGSFNRMVVSDGGRLDATGSPAAIGDNASARTNSVLVTGLGSRWRSRDLLIGYLSAFNELVASDGARIESTVAAIGQACTASDNFALITGAGTVWTNGTLEVGFCSTNNSLVISNGATVLAGLVRSSVQGGASNNVRVTGPGSLLRAAGNLIVGNSGTANSVLITDGARVEGRNDRVGFVGSRNRAIVGGLGTTWSNLSLIVGEERVENRLTFGNAARLDSGNVTIGSSAGANLNSVEIFGTGTVWDLTNAFTVGSLGSSNRVHISAGAQVNSLETILGAQGGSATSAWNRIEVIGSSTVLNATNALFVGRQGSDNRLEIREGAQVRSSWGVIGGQSFVGPFYDAARRNSALVTGAGSHWSNNGDFQVGGDGTHNDLVISDRGQVSCETGYIGAGGDVTGLGSTCQRYEGFNTAVVTGPGSLWQVRGRLFVGSNCYGNRLTISNGGIVTARHLFIGANSASPPGSSCGPQPDQNRLIVDGGCLVVTNAGFVSELIVRYGTLVLNRGVIETRDFRVHNGPFSRMEFRGGTFKTLNAIVRGLPFELGDGVQSAVFCVDGYDSSFEFLNISPHGVLRAGKGLNSTIITNAGTIVPGGPDSLRTYIEGPLTQLPQGNLLFDLKGRSQGTNYAFLHCSGTVRLDGSLRLHLRGGFLPNGDDVFEIVRGGTLIGVCTNAPHGDRIKTADNLGSFLVTYSSTNLLLSGYQSTDLDNDGLEDAWATNYFGHSPLLPTERGADADGDGASNADEFRAGTDPTNVTSVFKAVIAVSGDTVLVEFGCVDGKTYRIWFSNDLESWQEVPDPTFAFPRAGRCQWLDDGKDTGGEPAVPRFYRVSVE